MTSNGDDPASPARLPRPVSRASAPRTREAPTLRESLQYVADRNRLAIGSPSPAPRPSRQAPTSADSRPLAHLFADKPLEIGRVASKRPRRDGPLAAKTSFGSSHNDGDTDDEFERKLQKFEADDRLFEKLLKEEKNGPFAQRKLIGGSIARPMSARGGPTRPANGSRDGPQQVFAETGYGRQYTDMYRRLQQLEKDPEVLANHFNFLTGTDQGVKRKTYHQAGDLPAYRLSDDPLLRPATTAPSMLGSTWEAESDFSVDNIQGSTSPPVSFGRPNTRIDELREREIDAERQFPSPNKPLFLQRKNTKLEDLARLEKDVLPRYPIDTVDELVSSLVGDLPTIEEQPEGEGRHIRNVVPQSRLDQVKDRVLRERLASERQSTSEGQRINTKVVPDVPVRSSRRESPKSKGASSEEQNGFNGDEGDRMTNAPATVWNSGSCDNPRDVHKQPESKNDVPTLSQHQPIPPKEDSHDLLRRLARASSRSPSPKPVEDEAASGALHQLPTDVQPVPEARPASEYKFLRTTKPSVGFLGLSRSDSSTSVSSKTSALSGDPTARIAAEAKLFALDNNSERGSLRAPSPVSESEADVMADKVEDDTPRPTKFADLVSAPTPVVTGAFIDTPAPVKFTAYGEDVVDKPVVQNRDPSTSPRASKSDSGLRDLGPQTSSHDPRRSKSASRHTRHRSLPIKNTAKLPSVKDDLRQIYQRNNIDDSEVDELTGLLLAAEENDELTRILKTEAQNLDDDDAKDMFVDEQVKRMNGMSDALKTGLAQIRNARRGIERLEGQVSRPTNTTKDPIQNQPPAFPSADVHESDNFMYIRVPFPKLYRRTPKLRPTLFGFLMLLLCLWQLYWFVETLFYDQWGKQTVCYRGETCRWKVDDPEFGYVIPVKLDEWVTGGALRPQAAHWLEEAQDGWADLEDWLTDTDIRHVQHQAIRDPVEKAQYWRRIEKKGLFPEWKPAAWLMPEIEEWDRQALAREAAEARAAMGYDYDARDDSANDSVDDQSILRDEPVGRLW